MISALPALEFAAQPIAGIVDCEPPQPSVLAMTPPHRRVFRLHRKRKDSSETAANVDLNLAVHRRQHDVLDSRPDDIGGFCPLPLVLGPQCVVEALNAQAVELRH